MIAEFNERNAAAPAPIAADRSDPDSHRDTRM
jgi:hypothetical protein